MSALTLEQILALPYVNVEDIRRLPDAPGVYCAVIDRSQAGYVGMARTSIRGRWGYHHRLASLIARGAITIAYLIDRDVAEVAKIERATIKALMPLFNTHGIPADVLKTRPPLPPSTTSTGSIKITIAFTPEQSAWLDARAERRGRASVASVIRELMGAAMAADADVEQGGS